MLVTNEQTVLKITPVSAPGWSTPAASLYPSGPQRALAVGVQRQVLLGVEQAEGQDEEGGVERQQGDGVSLPIHRGRLAAAEQATEGHRQRIQAPADAVGRWVERRGPSIARSAPRPQSAGRAPRTGGSRSKIDSTEQISGQVWFRSVRAGSSRTRDRSARARSARRSGRARQQPLCMS